VLVAEDDAVLRQLIDGVLRSEGHVPLLAENGLRAVELFDSHADRISLVILDVIMPGRNGAEVAEHLWRKRPALPILFISGYFTDYLDPSLIPPDKGRILKKPYGQQELLVIVREMLACSR
jgi:CheY-like chemotaxis protein